MKGWKKKAIEFSDLKRGMQMNPNLGISGGAVDRSAFHVEDTCLEILPGRKGSRLKRELASLELDYIADKQDLRRTKRTRSQTQLYGRTASKISQDGTEKMLDDKVCLNPLTEPNLRLQREETLDPHRPIGHSGKMKGHILNYRNTKVSPSSSSQDCDHNETADDDTKQDSRSTLIGQDISRILEAINRKYGDITRDCSLQSPHMKVYALLGVCDLVQELRNKQLIEIHINDLDNYYKIVGDAEDMKMNVSWLRTRLDEIKVTVESIQEMEALVNERNTLLEGISNGETRLFLRKAELERLKLEVKDCEEQLNKEVSVVEKLDKKMSALTSKSSEFLDKFLMDGLL